MGEVRYQRRFAGTGPENWHEITRAEVERALAKNYEDLETIMGVLDEGEQVRTPFAFYRAVKA